MSVKDKKSQSSNKCWICNKLFTEDDKKLRDHGHITEKYRGSAHSNCNINLRLTKKFPVIFHSLIMQKIDKFDGLDDKSNGLEKYMAFIVSKTLVCIDIMQLMNSSLDGLVKNLTDNDFKYLSQEFSGDLLKLVKQKGAYPYKYRDGFKRFSEDKLPDRSKFFSSLKDECISKKDYLLANNVWSMFKMNTIGDYHDLYLKTDVLLSADVSEKFISTCLEYHRLDPCHYFSSPELIWDAMLKMTKIELELISDIDMYLFNEQGIRRGISYIAKRYSKANNKYMLSYDYKNQVYITFI